MPEKEILWCCCLDIFNNFQQGYHIFSLHSGPRKLCSQSWLWPNPTTIESESKEGKWIKEVVESMLQFIFNIKDKMQCAYKNIHVKSIDLKCMSIEKYLKMFGFLFGIVNLKHSPFSVVLAIL